MSNDYRTKRLHVAAYIDATMALEYLRAEYYLGKVWFHFADPHRQGPEIEASFDDGAVCPAVSIFGSLTKMRREMTAVQNRQFQPNGESREYRSQRS